MAALKFVFLLLVAVAVVFAAEKNQEKLESSSTIGLGYYNRGYLGGYGGYGGYGAYPYSGLGGYPYGGYYNGYGAYGHGAGYYPNYYNGYY